MMMFSMDDMVPQNHMLRLIDRAINWNFIYDLVEEKYCPDNGRPSMDPVMLIKIPFIQYLYGIKSMRQTMKEIEVNVAYRWFLGLDMLDPVPHFSTFGKNYTRRFKDTDLFEHIFSKILEKSTDGNESRAYLCMHESEKTGKDPGKTRLEHSQIFVDFEENKKKRSFKRKMVLGITPNTKFVYSLKPCCSHAPGFLFIYPYLNNQNFIQLLKTDLFQHYIMGIQNLLERPPTLFLVQYHLQDNLPLHHIPIRKRHIHISLVCSSFYYYNNQYY